MTEEEAEQEIKEALKPLIGKPVEEFQKLANEIIDNIKDKKIYDFKVECDITEPTLQDKTLEKYLDFFCVPEIKENNTLTGSIAVDPSIIFSGRTAQWCRESGWKIDKRVPDCAKMENGAWRWIEMDFTIDSTGINFIMLP